MGDGKKETIQNFFLSIISKICAYLIILILGNYYTQNDYGQAFYGLAIIGILNTIFFMGLPQALVPYIVKQKNANAILWGYFAVSLVVMILGIVISPGWLYPLLIVFPFNLLHKIELAILQARHKHNLLQVSNLNAVMIPLILVFILRNSGVDGIVMAYAAGTMITAILTLFFANPFVLRLQGKIKFKAFLGQAFPVWLIGLSFMVLGWIDSSILGIFNPYSDVAIYNISSSISSVIHILPISISLFLLTRSAQLSNKMGTAVLHRSIRISFSSSLIISIILVSLMDHILALFLPKYVSATLYITVLIVGIVFHSVYYLFYTNAIGKQNVSQCVKPMLSAMIVNIVLDIIFIPTLGVLGVVIATVLAHFTAFSLFIIQSKSYKYMLIVILMGLIVLPAFIGIYGLLLVIPGLYLCLVMDLIRIDDINSVKNSILSK
ncbi:hypothetical protein K9M79_06615 [Candidatus Woesearchaeota archaeon]|nr:hypothetical protein [Candidatus Woesearchaeota archaeon]